MARLIRASSWAILSTAASHSALRSANREMRLCVCVGGGQGVGGGARCRSAASQALTHPPTRCTHPPGCPLTLRMPLCTRSLASNAASRRRTSAFSSALVYRRTPLRPWQGSQVEGTLTDCARGERRREGCRRVPESSVGGLKGARGGNAHPSRPPPPPPHTPHTHLWRLQHVAPHTPHTPHTRTSGASSTWLSLFSDTNPSCLQLVARRCSCR